MQITLHLANFPYEASFFLLLIIKDEIIYSFSAASSKQGYIGKESQGETKKLEDGQ